MGFAGVRSWVGAVLAGGLVVAGLSVAVAQQVERQAPAGASAHAQAGTVVPSSAAAMKMSFAPVVARTAPAVVNVYALKIAQRTNPFIDDPFFRRFFGGGPGGGGLGAPERVQRSLGSGVIVDPSGLVVTNQHVIQGADQIRIALNDKREFDAEVLLSDQRTDLAVLRIKGEGAKFSSLEIGNSDELAVGDLVLAIGDPFGVGQTVTQGIVSALARTQVGVSDYQFFIQTDAAINPGNSGGALVDMDGRLVGINSAIYSRSGGSHGIGFAIPANMVKVVVASAKAGGKTVRRPWLGAKLQRVTPEIADSLGLQRPTGALVQSVATDGPAARAGLKTGDLIVAVEGQPIDDPESLNYRWGTRPLGGKANLGIVRQGRDQTLVVTLEPPPESVPRDEVVISSRSPFAGARVLNVSPAVADELRLDVDEGVVVISEVADGSPADAAGFRAGDIILEVNGGRIERTKDLVAATRTPSRAWKVTVARGGRTITAVLGG
ncbi:Do/DeqQ family serine protease [Azorhizobium sp. AG788]|uniref:Do family serine endopeptidase n=1 Tax=Azorhizobium sp. AG788 TaxID=2183897 RepID=UPI00105B642C|nr:Do family serine endopeptidase [Azorhizobium sp. AG788]TDT99691.1 Do/DeqQ family serine protease [Azorhizobium sp. AG788]